jgi:hypothetical protein
MFITEIFFIHIIIHRHARPRGPPKIGHFGHCQADTPIAGVICTTELRCESVADGGDNDHNHDNFDHRSFTTF